MTIYADLPPPPPPPSCPPPTPQETTTIGKYIARFRYEKPQSRESRVAANRGDFWWTRSPRYSRSPSPPSTWASGGIFNFSDDEKEDDISNGEKQHDHNINFMEKEERQQKRREEDDMESVASVESKLRRRLGLLGSDASEEIELRSMELMTPLGSGDWSFGELEKDATEVTGLEEVEDPERVIERVRKRLGWVTTSSAAVQRKPIEFHLALGDEEKRRTKLPPSPGVQQPRELANSVGSTFSPSWTTSTSERYDHNLARKITIPPPSGGETKGCAPEIMDAEACESVNLIKSDDKQSSGRTFYSLETTSMEYSVRSANSCLSESAASIDESETVPLQGNPIVATENSEQEQTQSVVLATPSICGGKDESQDDTKQSQSIRREDDYIADLSPLPEASFVRPLNSGMFGPKFPQDSSLISDSPTRVETAKTLDSLVNYVVHSWRTDHEEAAKSSHGGAESRTGTHSDENANIGASEHSCLDAEDREIADEKAVDVAADICEPSDPLTTESVGALSITSITGSSVEMAKPNCKEITDVEGNKFRVEDSEEVPGEEDDEIVQMLLQRIALLEEALLRIKT